MEIETATVTPPHKGRPREFCVDMALAAALRVFWSKGYEGASMADLTEAMGITKPSLYAAFGNKEALFHKALDLYESEKLDYTRAALEQPTARSEEHTSELQSLMRISYAVFCLKKKKKTQDTTHKQTQ